MTAFIIRRLLLLPVIVIGVTLLIYMMVQLLSPIQRLSLYVDEGALQRYDSQELDELVDYYGLNDPVFFPFTIGHIEIPLGITTLSIGDSNSECDGICGCDCTPQYFVWLSNILQGDLGWSETDKMPVGKAILGRLPATMELAILAIFPLIIIGISLGVLASVNHNKPIDHVTRIFSIMGYAFPVFVFGLLMLMIFYGKLGWFPPERLSPEFSCVINNDAQCQLAGAAAYVSYSGFNLIDSLLNGRLDIFWDAIRHLVLPVITLSYVSWALIIRITRSSMLETLRQDYVTVGRAKGQKEEIVILKHAARNALIPVATISGLVFAGWMGGVVITETIFSYRGLGKFAADAAISLDIPSVLGFTLFATSLLVIMNLVVDLLYAMIDPRVRLE